MEDKMLKPYFRGTTQMSRLDLVIFGATGFTGKYAVEEMCRISKNYPDITWAIAGRSQNKLKDMLTKISKINDEDLSSVKIIIADAQDEKSLKEMCSQAKVLVNCCGPYRHFGEPVVKAAIDSKTHYVDVSAEPEFIETMQLKYDEAARDAGVYIIRACGFDCIPSDMGVIFLQKNFKGTLNSVELYLSFEVPFRVCTGGLVNYGTWESLLYEMAHHRELPALRKKLYAQELPAFEPKLKPRRIIHRLESTWCAPFPSCDEGVVYNTQRYLYEKENLRPAQFKPYVKSPNLLLALVVLAATFIIYFLSRFTFTRTFMLNWPRLCTMTIVSKTPSESTVKATKFKFKFLGKGWDAGTDVDAVPPNKKMTVMVSGTNGYSATAVALIFSAITLLKESDKMPAYGVITPGVAFRNTNLINHLNENNLKFEVVESEVEE